MKSPHAHGVVRRAILDYIQKWIPRQRAGVLAGNSVHADRVFLVQEMPEVVDWLHYRCVFHVQSFALQLADVKYFSTLGLLVSPEAPEHPHFVRSSSLPKTFLQLRFVAGKLPSCLSAQSLAARSFAEGGILPKSCKKRMMITGKPPSIIYFLAAIVYPTIVLRALADISASINGNKTPGSSLRSLTLRLPFTELKWYRERIFVSPGSGNH